MSEVGIYIKSKREEQNVSFEELYERTKIRVIYLKAIEEGNFKELPGEVYLRGFLRTISRELNLDNDHVLGLYEAESNKANVDSSNEENKIKTGEVGEKSNSNAWIWVIVSLIVIGGAVAIYMLKLAPQSLPF